MDSKTFKQYRGLCRFIYKKYGFGRYTNNEMFYIAGRESYDISTSNINPLFLHNAKICFLNRHKCDSLLEKHNLLVKKLCDNIKPKKRTVKRTIIKTS